MKLLKTSLAAAVLSLAGAASAQDAGDKLDKALDKGELRTRQAAQSQSRVDEAYTAARTAADEYKGVLKQIEGMRVYMDQMRAQIGSQEAELAKMAVAIEEVQGVDRQIVPLMLRMIDTLDQFVGLDLPFLVDERKARVQRLREMIGRADVTVAEKFRNVMQALSTELAYGNTIEAYRGKDADGREVDYLRIGRLGLYFQTLDGSASGRWNPQAKAWEGVADSYNSSILRGLRMAREQSAPDLIRLPLQTAEAAQ